MFGIHAFWNFLDFPVDHGRPERAARSVCSAAGSWSKARPGEHLQNVIFHRSRPLRKAKRSACRRCGNLGPGLARQFVQVTLDACVRIAAYCIMT